MRGGRRRTLVALIEAGQVVAIAGGQRSVPGLRRDALDWLVAVGYATLTREANPNGPADILRWEPTERGLRILGYRKDRPLL